MEAPPLQKLVGRRIRELRVRAGLTQADLAGRIGMPSKYLAGVEAGVRNVTLRNLERLSQGLRVTPRELMAPGSAKAPSKQKGQEALFTNLLRQCDPAARTHVLRLLRRISALSLKRR